MPNWIGRFDERGSPILNIEVSLLPERKIQLEAVLDTGFTGFLVLPLEFVPALPAHLYELRTLRLADGSRVARLQVPVSVIIGDIHLEGTAYIEPDGTAVLLGMEFLLVAKRALLLRPSKGIMLLEEDSG